VLKTCFFCFGQGKTEAEKKTNLRRKKRKIDGKMGILCEFFYNGYRLFSVTSKKE
jgi:hypothetical protein